MRARYSALHPAMAQLIAIFSTLASPSPGNIFPIKNIPGIYRSPSPQGEDEDEDEDDVEEEEEGGCITDGTIESNGHM